MARARESTPLAAGVVRQRGVTDVRDSGGFQRKESRVHSSGWRRRLRAYKVIDGMMASLGCSASDVGMSAASRTVQSVVLSNAARWLARCMENGVEAVGSGGAVG